MKITRRQLRRLILQEVQIKPDVAADNPAVFLEHIIKPDASTSGIPPKYLDKIHKLIDSGDPEMFNMAVSLIDGLGGDSSYAYGYRDYDKVGDLEKLGNKASDILHDLSSGTDTPEMYDDVYGPEGTNIQADSIISDRADAFDDPAAWVDAYSTHSERYQSVKNRPRPKSW